MALNFNNYAAKGNAFINELARELGDEKSANKAGRITRAVLRTLRTQITIEESFQLMSQLPMMLKALYMEGWKPNKKYEKIKHTGTFIEAVMSEYGSPLEHDFPNITDIKWAIKAVFKIIRQHISEGEYNDIEGVLPHELKMLLKESFNYKKIIIKLK